MKRTLFFIALSVLAVNGFSQDKYSADLEKTKLSWLGEKVTGEHEGSVNLKSGSLLMKDNQIVSGEFVIDMNSIKDIDANARLEGHLKSDDFFGTEKFPTATLALTGSTSFAKGTAVVKGNLTIKGTTLPIEFKAARQTKEDGEWFFANIVIDRTKYNIRYGSGTFFDNLGDKTIFDEFKIKVTLLVKK